MVLTLSIFIWCVSFANSRTLCFSFYHLFFFCVTCTVHNFPCDYKFFAQAHIQYTDKLTYTQYRRTYREREKKKRNLDAKISDMGDDVNKSKYHKCNILLFRAIFSSKLFIFFSLLLLFSLLLFLEHRALYSVIS